MKPLDQRLFMLSPQALSRALDRADAREGVGGEVEAGATADLDGVGARLSAEAVLLPGLTFFGETTIRSTWGGGVSAGVETGLRWRW